MDFGHYMTTVRHIKARELLTGDLNRYQLKWQTESKVPNSGVFVMRHMETYMGDTCDKYECGLVSDARKQRNQLNRLRKKYACKILLSGCNILLPKIRGMFLVADGLDKFF